MITTLTCTGCGNPAGVTAYNPKTKEHVTYCHTCKATKLVMVTRRTDGRKSRNKTGQHGQRTLF